MKRKFENCRQSRNVLARTKSPAILSTPHMISGALKLARFYSSLTAGRKPSWQFYLATFIVGGIAGKLLNVDAILEYGLNSSLPKDDPESVALYLKNLEEKQNNLSIVKELSKNVDYQKYRDWAVVQESKTLQTKSMTGDVLAVPGGFAIKPLIFSNPKTKETVTIIYLGPKLCGYPFLVHGGILATILDETFRKTVGLETTTASIVTKDLELSYRFPTIANRFVVIRSKVAMEPNNQYLVTGTISSSSDKLLVKGRAHFDVPPKKHFWGYF